MINLSNFQCIFVLIFVWTVFLFLHSHIRLHIDIEDHSLTISSSNDNNLPNIIDKYLHLKNYKKKNVFKNEVEVEVENEIEKDQIKKQIKKKDEKDTITTTTAIKENEEILLKKDNKGIKLEEEKHDIDDAIHIVFSTDCRAYQDWQSLLLFHSAHSVGQKGTITRIASGCEKEKDSDKGNKLTELYHDLWPNYHIHFTPNYKKDTATGKNYEFYNKPYGILHFLEHGYVDSNAIIVIVDPDFIFLRPITRRIANESSTLLVQDRRRKSNNNNQKDDFMIDYVDKGKPAAQLYGLGAPWTDDHHRHFNRSYICDSINSPCLHVDRRFGERHYSVGPPYLLHYDDLLRLTKTWVHYVPRVFKLYPYLLAEMYAYSMAAAHENLPHTTLMNYMVSNTQADDEGWKWVDKLNDKVCEPLIDTTNNNKLFYPSYKAFPTVLHYCQFFRAGEIGFQKRRLTRLKPFSCESPMMLVLPNDLGKVTYKNRDGEIIKLGPIQAKRNAFMLCTIHSALNAAMVDYKTRMCDENYDSVNYNRSINVVRNEKF